MFGRRIFMVVLLGLLVIGLLSLGGYMGWSQGYAAGLAAADGGDGALAPRAFYGYGFFPFFFGFGLFFKFTFFLLLFFFILKMFSFWTWRMAGGPPYRRHGPPPWYRGEKEESVGETEADSNGEQAETRR